jgi:hypothetical protein
MSCDVVIVEVNPSSVVRVACDEIVVEVRESYIVIETQGTQGPPGPDRNAELDEKLNLDGSNAMTGPLTFTDMFDDVSVLLDAPDATSTPELQLFGGKWLGDFDTSVPENGVRLGGAYIALESNDISVRLNDAQVGGRLIVAGFTERGNAILGAEPPPEPAYVVEAINAVDVTIYSGGGLPSPWVDVCDLLTVGQDVPEHAATIFIELLVDSIGSKAGDFEIGLSIDGAAPISANTIRYAIGSNVKQIYANTATNASALPSGTTARLQARAHASSGNGFQIVARNSERPSRLRLTVAPSLTGLLREIADLRAAVARLEQTIARVERGELP